MIKFLKKFSIAFLFLFVVLLTVSCTKDNTYGNSDANEEINYDASANKAVEDIIESLDIGEAVPYTTEEIIALCVEAKIPQKKLLAVCTFIEDNLADSIITLSNFVNSPSNPTYVGEVYDLYIEIDEMIGSTSVGRVVYVILKAALKDVIAEKESYGYKDEQAIAEYLLKHLETIDIEHFAASSRVVLGWINQSLFDREYFIETCVSMAELVETSITNDEMITFLMAVATKSEEKIEVLEEDIKILMDLAKKLSLDLYTDELFALMELSEIEIEILKTQVALQNAIYAFTYNELGVLITLEKNRDTIMEKFTEVKTPVDAVQAFLTIYDDILTSKQTKKLNDDIDTLLKEIEKYTGGVSESSLSPSTPPKNINSTAKLIIELRTYVTAFANKTEDEQVEELRNILSSYLMTMAPSTLYISNIV